MIQPLKNQVLIEPLKAEEKLKGGIILPDTAEKDDPKKGKIIAMGKIIQDGKEIKPEVKKGDIIIHDAYGRELKEGSKELMLIKYEDILAVIK